MQRSVMLLTERWWCKALVLNCARVQSCALVSGASDELIEGAGACISLPGIQVYSVVLSIQICSVILSIQVCSVVVSLCLLFCVQSVYVFWVVWCISNCWMHFYLGVEWMCGMVLNGCVGWCWMDVWDDESFGWFVMCEVSSVCSDAYHLCRHLDTRCEVI